jgi:hypothetical protein
MNFTDFDTKKFADSRAMEQSSSYSLGRIIKLSRSNSSAKLIVKINLMYNETSDYPNTQGKLLSPTVGVPDPRRVLSRSPSHIVGDAESLLVSKASVFSTQAYASLFYCPLVCPDPIGMCSDGMICFQYHPNSGRISPPVSSTDSIHKATEAAPRCLLCVTMPATLHATSRTGACAQSRSCPGRATVMPVAAGLPGPGLSAKVQFNMLHNMS